MRIMLVEPPFHAFMHYDRWYYPTSLAQLAAVAHAAGHDAVIYDADKYFYKDPANRERSVFIQKQHLYYDNVDDFGHPIWRHLRQALEDFDPEVVGVSFCTSKLKSALNTFEMVREFNPDIKTCAGGAHATAVPEALDLNNDIDSVFLGYADLTFPEWLKSGCPRSVIKGDLRDIDLEKLPYVRRQALLFPEYYSSRDLSMMTMSRGCLGQCTFCANSLLWSGRPRFRTSGSIIAELTELLQEWKATGKDVMLGDASFSDVPEEALRAAKILKDFGARWECNISWAATKKLLESFMDSGCYRIAVGLESGSDKILRYVKKACNKRLMREKARMINSLGIKWHAHCVVGFPIETLEDMQETLDFVLEIRPTTVSLNSMAPLPGTGVYGEISGITPEAASTVTQLYPNHSFSKYVDSDTFKNMFMKMTKIFDDYNNRQKSAAGEKGWEKEKVYG